MPELSYRELQRIRNIKKSAAYNRPIGDYADGQQGVGERCVKCGHEDSRSTDGHCQSQIPICPDGQHDGTARMCGCRCVFSSAPESRSAGERIETCVECHHNKSTWNPVNGYCEFDPNPDDDSGDYCGCKCVFGFDSEGDRIVYECSLRQVIAPEWGTPQKYVTEFDEEKLTRSIDAAISKAKADTWKKAIDATSSADLYRHPTTNPEHDRLKSAQEVKAEIVRVLETGAGEVK